MASLVYIAFILHCFVNAVVASGPIRYDSGGIDPVCWVGIAIENTFNASEENVEDRITSLSLDFSGGLKNNISYPIEWSGDVVDSSCPLGTKLDVTLAPELRERGPEAGGATKRDLFFPVSGTIDFTKVVPDFLNVTRIVEVGVEIFLCPVEELGFCNPFLQVLVQSNGRPRVQSPLLPLDEELLAGGFNESVGEFHFDVDVPIFVENGGGFSILSSVMILLSRDDDEGLLEGVLPSNSSTANASSVDPEMPLFDFVRITNMPIPPERFRMFNDDRDPPVEIFVEDPAVSVSYSVISVASAVVLFLLFHTVKHQKNQVLQLTQGRFLCIMLCAGLVAIIFSFSFNPSPLNCHLIGPFVVLPLHVMFAISAGRLWRINAVISPLLLLTLEKTETTFNQRVVKLIQNIVSCSTEKKIRRQITEWHLARVILIFTLPQILIQIAIAVNQPNAYVENMTTTRETTTIVHQCGDMGLFRSPLEIASLSTLGGIFLVVFIMAGSGRDLPSLFNETQVLFEVTCIAAIITGIVMFTAFAGDVNQSQPAVEYLVCVFGVCFIATVTSIKITLPKLRRVWSGEVVFVSKLLATHAKAKDRSSRSMSQRATTYTDFRQPPTPSTPLPGKLKSEGTKQESSGELVRQDSSDAAESEDLLDSVSSLDVVTSLSAAVQASTRKLLQTVPSSRSLRPMDEQRRVSVIEHLPDQPEEILISENEPPPRTLLLRMIDLQKQLASINRKILSGSRLEQSAWTELHSAGVKFGDLMDNNVKFKWDVEAELERELLLVDMISNNIIEESHEASGDAGTSRSTSSGSTGRLSSIAALLKSNLEVRDRKYKFVTYERCFVASDAVDVLVSSGHATSRAHAVQICKKLQRDMNLFQHVCGDHDFQDDYLFFRFVGIHSFGNSTFASALEKIDEVENFSNDHSSLEVALRRGWQNDKVNLEKNLAKLGIILKTNVQSKNRRWRASLYPNCFVASEAVDYIVNAGLANSREDAVALCRQANEKFKFFEHVTQDHIFSDDYLFFRFVQSTIDKDDSSSHGIQSLVLKDNSPSVVSDLAHSDTGSRVANLKTRSPWRSMTSDGLQVIAHALRQEVELRANTYRFTVYENTFVGKEAVDFLVGSGNAVSRKDAVDLGRCLARRFKLFRHCCNDHELKDDNVFYSFTDEESLVEGPPDASKKSNCESGARSRLSRTSSERLETLDDDGLAEVALSLKRGVPIRDRKYHFVTYRDCFLGRQAVDFLINSGMARSRKAATNLAIRIMERFELYEQVTREHGFEDGYRFYRFLDGNSHFTRALQRIRMKSRRSFKRIRSSPMLKEDYSAEEAEEQDSLADEDEIDVERGNLAEVPTTIQMPTTQVLFSELLPEDSTETTTAAIVTTSPGGRPVTAKNGTGPTPSPNLKSSDDDGDAETALNEAKGEEAKSIDSYADELDRVQSRIESLRTSPAHAPEPE